MQQVFVFIILPVILILLLVFLLVALVNKIRETRSRSRTTVSPNEAERPDSTRRKSVNVEAQTMDREDFGRRVSFFQANDNVFQPRRDSMFKDSPQFEDEEFAEGPDGQLYLVVREGGRRPSHPLHETWGRSSFPWAVSLLQDRRPLRLSRVEGPLPDRQEQSAVKAIRRDSVRASTSKHSGQVESETTDDGTLDGTSSIETESAGQSKQSKKSKKSKRKRRLSRRPSHTVRKSKPLVRCKESRRSRREGRGKSPANKSKRQPCVKCAERRATLHANHAGSKRKRKREEEGQSSKSDFTSSTMTAEDETPSQYGLDKEAKASHQDSGTTGAKNPGESMFAP